MFFTLSSHSTSVLERAQMDGSDRKKLVTEKIVNPNGLTVDIPTESIYWVDTYLGTIEKISYNGTHRRTVIKNTYNFFPTATLNLCGISIFEDYLYVTNVDGNNILAIQKYNLTAPRSIKSNMTQPYAIRVFHRQKQPNG